MPALSRRSLNVARLNFQRLRGPRQEERSMRKVTSCELSHFVEAANLNKLGRANRVVEQCSCLFFLTFPDPSTFSCVSQGSVIFTLPLLGSRRECLRLGGDLRTLRGVNRLHLAKLKLFVPPGTSGVSPALVCHLLLTLPHRACFVHLLLRPESFGVNER